MRKLIIVISAMAAGIVGLLPLFAGNPELDLQNAIQKKDFKPIAQAIEVLDRQNDELAYNLILSHLKMAGAGADYQTYALLLTGIGRLTNPELGSKIAALIIDNQDNYLGKDVLAIGLKANRAPAAVPILSAVMKKGAHDMQLECIYQLSTIYDKASLETLIDSLKSSGTNGNDKKNTVKAVVAALQGLTGEIYTTPDSWANWWAGNKDNDISKLIKPKVKSNSFDTVAAYRDTTGLASLPPGKIAVVWDDKGTNYDNIDEILTRMKIPHISVRKSALADDTFDWDSLWGIFFNCMNTDPHCICPLCHPENTGSRTGLRNTYQCSGCNVHIIYDPKLTEKPLRKIRQFVENGGYLFTEDLNIIEILEPAFKGYITHNRSLPTRNVSIFPARGNMLHPYLKYVFESPPKVTLPAKSGKGKDNGTISVKAGEFRVDTMWNIHDESPNIKIQNKQAVTTLIVSPELAGRDDEGAVVVTFAVGSGGFVITDSQKHYAPGGRVLHVMSHFGEQRIKMDEFLLQNLLLNFITELNERHPRK